MLLRQLEYLTALARERHFGRAAAACHVSQPALSTAIAKLEAELGLRLVRRGGREAPLTDEGAALLRWAQSAVGSAGALATEAAALRGHLTATLRLGVIPTAVAAVPAVVGPVLDAHPGVRIEVRTRTGAQIAAGIADHELDAGLAYVDAPPRDVVVTPLYRERFVLLTTAELDADGDGGVPWARLAVLPLCLLTPEMQHRRIVDDALRTAGVTVRPRIEADSFPVLLGLLGDGWSTVVGSPWLAGRTLPPGVRAHALMDPVVAPSIGLLGPAGDLVPPVVRALRDALAGVDLQARLQHGDVVR